MLYYLSKKESSPYSVFHYSKFPQVDNLTYTDEEWYKQIKKWGINPELENSINKESDSTEIDPATEWHELNW